MHDHRSNDSDAPEPDGSSRQLPERHPLKWFPGFLAALAAAGGLLFGIYKFVSSADPVAPLDVRFLRMSHHHIPGLLARDPSMLTKLVSPGATDPRRSLLLASNDCLEDLTGRFSDSSLQRFGRTVQEAMFLRLSNTGDVPIDELSFPTHHEKQPLAVTALGAGETLLICLEIEYLREPRFRNQLGDLRFRWKGQGESRPLKELRGRRILWSQLDGEEGLLLGYPE